MEYEQWLGILTSINADNNLNESNVIDKIKEKLEKEDPGTYQEWQDNQCGINYTLDSQLTLLHIAATNGLAKVTELLIKKGADIDAVDLDDCTPLYHAAENGHTEIVNALIDKGADIHVVGENNCTPLHFAAKKGHTNTVKALIDKGAEVDAVNQNCCTPLHYAAANGHADTVEALIDKEADINAVDLDDCTPLYYAAKNGHADTVKVLIDKEAEVDAVDQDCCTPLHLAAKEGHTDTVKVLIDKVADIDAVDLDSCTPLYYAAANGHADIVKVLIDKGANVNVLSESDKMTPLHLAAANGHTDTVKALKGANVNVLSESDKVTPLYLAVQSGHAEIVKALMKKGANPLLENKNYRTFKRLIELIKNNSLEHLPKKAEETQQREEQVDDEYELLKYSLLFRRDCTLIDVIERDTLGNLICTWFADVSHLTQDQKKLNEKLLNILVGFLCHNDGSCNDYITKLESFLQENESNEDLKNILDLKRGESQSTVLHALSSVEDLEVGKVIDLLLKAGADRNIKNGRGETPINLAIDNHNYRVEKYFLTDNQERLRKELSCIVGASGFFTDFTKLKEFLSKHKNTQDLKRILNLRDREGKSKILLNLRIIFYQRHFPDCATPYEEAKRLLLEAGAIDYKRLDGKEHSPKSGTLWDNLILNQQQKLKMFLDVVGKAQDMNQLEQIVNEAIESGVRFNFLVCPGEMMYQDTYNFTDYVIKRISELEKNPKVASDIICKLVSKGAALHNLSSIDVIDTLESEFKDHKTNMKKAHEEYVNNTLEFMEIVKNAATGRVKNAKMDNSTFYLEYSENSKIDIAKITDGARDLGLTQGEIEYGRDIIKIGKSEVEIITAKGIRHYTDLADGSDIVLTFSTSLGELEVNLSPDKQDKDKIIVEVNNQGLLERLKNCNEKIGKNCSFGGLSVNKAIKQGFFVRSGKLRQPSETISTPKGIAEEVIETEKGLQCGDIVNSSLSDITLSSPIKESIKQIQAQGA